MVYELDIGWPGLSVKQELLSGHAGSIPVVHPQHLPKGEGPGQRFILAKAIPEVALLIYGIRLKREAVKL